MASITGILLVALAVPGLMLSRASTTEDQLATITVQLVTMAESLSRNNEAMNLMQTQVNQISRRVNTAEHQMQRIQETVNSRNDYVSEALEELEKWALLDPMNCSATDSKVAQLENEKKLIKLASFTAHGVDRPTMNVLVVHNDTVIFPATSLNNGSYYDTSSGRYTCPQDGIYFFNFALSAYRKMNASSRNVMVTLVKDGTTLASARLQSTDLDLISLTLGQSVITECASGERVWVEMPGNHMLYTEDRRNLFSGFPIHIN